MSTSAQDQASSALVLLYSPSNISISSLIDDSHYVLINWITGESLPFLLKSLNIVTIDLSSVDGERFKSLLATFHFESFFVELWCLGVAEVIDPLYEDSWSLKGITRELEGRFRAISCVSFNSKTYFVDLIQYLGSPPFWFFIINCWFRKKNTFINESLCLMLSNCQTWTNW